MTHTHTPPVTRLAEVDAHVATRWSLLEEEQLVSGVGDSGDRVHPQTAREEKILTKTIPGPTGGRPGIRGPSSSTWPASREQLPVSAGLGEQWLAGGSSVTGALPARKSAFVPWGRGWGQARPRKGQEEESSPIHRPDRRNRQVPGGSQCPPRKGRTPEGPARRGAGDQTRTDPDTRTTGAPLHFLHRTDGAGLLRAMTSSKPGTTSSTCPARATAPLRAPPVPGAARPAPGRRHQRVPVTTTAFRGCSMALRLHLKPA